MGWSEERVSLLKTLCGAGLSCAQIAGRLGGVTRNAVIGKLFRLGLSARGYERGRRKPSHAAPRPRHAARVARMDRQRRVTNPAMQKLLAEPFVPQPEPIIPPHERQPILVRKHDGLHANDKLTDSSCRWPCGDVGDAEFGFCGHTKVPGLPYCEPHARIAFNATNPDRHPRKLRVIVNAERVKVSA